MAVYANFDDGTYEDVTGDSSLLSLLPSSLGVLSDDDSGSKGVVVEVGADTVCYPALEASLSVCGVAIAEGHGVVMLDMPEAVSVTVSPSSSKMTRVGDGASLEPFNVATMVSLSVMVGFDDGSFKSFSSDTRTAIAVVSDGSDTMVELHDDQSLAVLPSATIRADSSLARVLVSFPGTFAVSATGSVRVVELADSWATRACCGSWHAPVYTSDSRRRPQRFCQMGPSKQHCISTSAWHSHRAIRASQTSPRCRRGRE